MKNKYLLAVLCVCLSTFIWSSSFIALKIALEGMNGMSIIFLRMLIASLVFLFFYKHFINLNITKKDLKYIIFMVVCEPGLYFVFETNALKYTSASQAGVITSVMPLITALGAALFLKEKITKMLIIGSLIAVVGAMWLSLSANVQSYAQNPILGNTLEGLAMLCAAGYALSLKHLSAKFSAIFLTAVQSFGGMIFFLPLSIIEFQSVGFRFEINSFFAILYLGIVVTMLGYGLFNYAISLAHASKISNFVNLMPVFTIILAFIILDERLNFNQILATAVIFLGVFLSQNIKFKKQLYNKIKK